MNPRPLSMKKKVQLMLALTILAWATQTLLAQWGLAQVVEPPIPVAEAEARGEQVEHVDLDAPPAETQPAGDDASAAEPQEYGSSADADGAPADIAGFDDAALVAPADEAAQADGVEAQPEDAGALPARSEERVGDEAAAAPLRRREEQFVPGTARFAAGATLELRSEARVFGAEVRLKQVCRWTEQDRAAFEPLADLVLTRLGDEKPFESITLPQLKATLRDAGANLAVIRFAGPTSCTVSRTDVEFDEREALQKWANAQEAGGDGADAAAHAGDDAAAGQESVAGGAAGDGGGEADVAPPTALRESADPSPVRTLRALLVADVSARLGVPESQLEVAFNPRDEKILKLAEPLFTFSLKPKRVRNLGSVSWDVTIASAHEGARPQSVLIAGSARAWQQQVVLTRPLTFKQVIRADDLTQRRTLIDRLPEDALLAAPQVVGQQAARDLKPGTIFTAKLVAAVPLVQRGQFVTVTLERGGVTVKTVARAMEGGSFGQTVRVKNEATRDVYEVVLTGPQEGTLGGSTASAAAANEERQEQPSDVASVPQD